MTDSEMKAIFYLSGGFILGIFFFFTGFRYFRRKRLIENVPTSTVRSIAMGLVEVKGNAHPAGTCYKTPFSLTECVYFQYKVEELRSSGKHSKWVTIAKGTSGGKFYLEDETGRVLIDPNKAEVNFAVDRSYKTSWFSGKYKEDFEAGLARLGVDVKGFLGFKKTLRAEERYLEPGDFIYVLGTARDNPAVDLTAKGTENIIIGKGKDEKFFYIADKSEKEILKHLGFWSVFSLYGGPALSVACLFLLILLLTKS